MRERARSGSTGFTLLEIVIVLLATFLAILLGRGADPVRSARSQAADCAMDTITLVASHQTNSHPACEEPARAKSAGSRAAPFER